VTTSSEGGVPLGKKGGGGKGHGCLHISRGEKRVVKAQWQKETHGNTSDPTSGFVVGKQERQPDCFLDDLP